MSGHVSDEQISLLLDSALSLAAREAVLGHVRSCPVCADRHDRLVELTATVRLAGRLDWTQQQTESTLARVRGIEHKRPSKRRRRRDWSLPVAAALALAGLGALLLVPLGIESAVFAAPSGVSGFFAFALPVSGRVLGVLVAAVTLGCLAYPLSRSR